MNPAAGCVSCIPPILQGCWSRLAQTLQGKATERPGVGQGWASLESCPSGAFAGVQHSKRLGSKRGPKSVFMCPNHKHGLCQLCYFNFVAWA